MKKAVYVFVILTAMFLSLILGIHIGRTERYDTYGIITSLYKRLQPETAEQAPKHVGKVNINSAPLEDLLLVPGIGKATAEDIIAYREKNGKFEKIEDIMKIQGIGEKKFKEMQDMICVD